MSLGFKENLFQRWAVFREDDNIHIGYIFRNPQQTAYMFYPNDVNPLSLEVVIAIHKNRYHGLILHSYVLVSRLILSFV
jgi:hypothetical protein